MFKAQPLRVTILALILGAGGFGPTARALAAPLPPALISKPALSTPERQEVAQFVAGETPALTGAPDKVKIARDHLIAPLAGASVSVDFRQAMGEALLPELTRLVKDPSDFVASNALRIAGELATSASVNLMLQALSDQRAPVRSAACTALGRAFEQASRAAPAMNLDTAGLAVRSLGQFLEAQSDPLLVDAAVLALTSAVRVPPAQINGLRDQAAAQLTVSVTQRVKGVSADAAAPRPDSIGLLAVFARAAVNLRNITGDAEVSGGLPRDTLRAESGLSGHVLAATSRTLKALKQISPDDAALRRNVETLRQVTAANEGLLLLALSTLQGKAVQRLDLAAAIDPANPQAFQEVLVARVLGPSGLLSQPPLSFPAGTFTP